MTQRTKGTTGLVHSENRAWDDIYVRDARIESVPGIKGTRITAHGVEARLSLGDSLDEIAAENPDLPREAFEAAVLFAKAHPLSPAEPSLRRRSPS